MGAGLAGSGLAGSGLAGEGSGAGTCAPGADGGASMPRVEGGRVSTSDFGALSSHAPREATISSKAIANSNFMGSPFFRFHGISLFQMRV